MKIVVPIAGRGSRFHAVAHTNPEFKKPKPFIDVKGYPMVYWATSSLPFLAPKDLIFVALIEHEEKFQISKMLTSLYSPEIQIVFIPDVTRGAAETVSHAKEYIDPDEQLIISDSDHFIDGQAIEQSMSENPDIDGLIPVFEAHEPKWSFSRINKDGYIDLVAEKKPISTYANIGAYYFRKAHDFLYAAQKMIASAELTNNEFYIAPVYNKLIQNGKKIKPVFPEYTYGLGTPEDLAHFITNTTFTQPV